MAHDSSTLLRLTLFGSPQITRADGTTVALRSRKHVALLFYLAMEQRRSTSRDTLLELLWPEADEEAARNNLRVALADIRRGLGDAAIPFLQTTRHTVQFDSASDHTLDALLFRVLLEATQRHDHGSLATCAECLARLEHAVALYAGNFLHGFSLPDSSAFEEWALIQREQLHQAALEAFSSLAIACEQQGDHAAQCRYARRQIELEPWREQAHAQLMRGLWASGQRGAALEQYETCRRILEAELGLEPSPELTALYEQLRARESSAFSGLSAEPSWPVAQTRPAPSSLQHEHNLPVQPTSFVGREAQLADLRQAITRARLLTLTGPGGCGKTRLALELAATSLPQYADGVWLVPLEPLRDPALIPQAIAEALGLQTASDQGASALLGTALRPKQLLLVLDTCEHLVAACRTLAETLLRECPQLTILATSREMLRASGEVMWPVPPLSAHEDAGASLDQLLGSESIRLFVERAAAASSGFTLTTRNAPAVIQICRQLDNMPLALELAAARVRHMPVETIAARLDDRFGLLTGSTPSQQRLRAAIDWSYALLGDTERAGFRRLAVFAGGFTLDAAEEVIGEPGEVRTDDLSTVELLAQLIDKSLVVAEQRPSGLRYRLLETMRAYARDQLQTGEAEAVRARHAAYFLHLAEQAETQLVGDEQIAWLDLVAAEHANVRAAVDWATERGGIVAALRLVTALRYFWRVRGYYAEGIELLRGLLAHPSAAATTTVHARALNAAGYLEFVRGQQARSRELLEAALVIGRTLADLPVIAFALRYLSALASAQQAYSEARASGEESLAIYRSLGATNDIAVSSMYLGDIALSQGDDDRAEALYAESAAILRTRRNSISLAYPLRHLGYLALRRGQPDRAAALCEESLRLNLAIGDQQGVAACLVGLAASAAATKRFEHAARLLGHAEGLLEDLHTRLLPYDRVQHEQVRDQVDEQLGEAVFAAAHTTGHAMTIEQLLADDQPVPEHIVVSRGETSTLPVPLTPCIGRDGELAELAALLHQPEVRLLTLVGVGGIGKTRLAQELGQRAIAEFTDGAHFVPLAPIADAAAIAPAILASLDEPPGSGDPRRMLLQSLRTKRLLLILDNFEHLMDGVDLVADIVQAAPQVTVVATSRERLNLRGEHQYLLRGLAYTADATLAGAAEGAAARLFTQSARRARSNFVLTSKNLGAVLRICQLVEGMPLGLELAATWIEMLSPADIAAEIEQSADFLATEWRDLPERQRSMRAVFDWSWRLLGDAEREGFKQLAIFRGGFSHQAARAVAGVSLPVLNRLVHKALVRPNGSNERAGRFEIHELLRQFALEHLNRNPADVAAVAARHASFYLELVERDSSHPNIDQEAWLQQIADDHDNIRTALAYCLETGGRQRAAGSRATERVQDDSHTSNLLETGLRLAGAVWPFWQRHSYFSEGRNWIERFLAAAPEGTISTSVRATALYGLGWLAHDQDDFASADAYFSEGLQLDQALGQTDRVAAVLAHRGIMARGQGQYAEATALLEQSLALARDARDQAGIAYALFRFGLVTRESGDIARSTEIYQQCLAIYRALGDRAGVGFVLLGMGDIARDKGDVAQLQAYSSEGLAIGKALDQPWIVGFALNNLALAAVMRGEMERAASLADEALALFRTHGVRGGEVELFITRGQVAVAAQDAKQAVAFLADGIRRGWPAGPHWLVATGLEEVARLIGPGVEAVRLLGAMDAWRTAMGAPRPAYRRVSIDTVLAAARHAFGEEQFAAAWADGAAWPPEQAVRAGLEQLTAFPGNTASLSA